MNTHKIGDLYYASSNGLYARAATKEEAEKELKRVLALPRINLDWKLMLMKILEGVADAEGVFFEDHWPVTDEERVEILRTYNEYNREE